MTVTNAGGYDDYSGFDKSPYGSTYPGELIVVACQSASNDRVAAAQQEGGSRS